MSVAPTIAGAVTPTQAGTRSDASSSRHSRAGGNPVPFRRYPTYKDSGVEWLGEVPAHWRIRKIKDFTRFFGGGTPSRDVPEFWNGDIPWVSPKDMKCERIVRAEESITDAGLAGSTSCVAEPGHVLLVVRSGILKHTIPVAINAVAVALNQDMKALAFESESCTAAYFMRWVQGHNDALLLVWSKQGATVESIEHEYLANTPMPLPTVEEQAAIAAFLDRETGKIDALVAEQEKLIALLKEKRQALISHAVTKGLNPGAAMKPSGIDWLGDVPAHWATTPLKVVCSLLNDGTHLPPPRVTHGVPLLSVRNIVDGKFTLRQDDSLISSDDYVDLCRSFTPAPGDVVLAIVGATIGKSAIIPTGLGDFQIQRSIAIFRTRNEVVDAHWLNNVFQSKPFQSLLWAQVGFSAQPGIYLNTLANFRVPVPPMREQRHILGSLTNALQRIDALTSEADHGATLLNERRTALISAAVTGKIDVRGVGAV